MIAPTTAPIQFGVADAEAQPIHTAPAAERFLREVWGDQPGWVFLAQGVDGRWQEAPGGARRYTFEKENWRERRFRLPHEWAGLLAFLRSQPASGARIDWYFAPAVFSGPERRKETARSARVVWLESDNGELPPDLPPTLTVESGSPGHFHAYWSLDTPLPAAEIADINRALAAVAGGDAKWQSNSLLRIPGTCNCKHDPPTPVLARSHTPASSYCSEDFAPLVAAAAVSRERREPGIDRATQDGVRATDERGAAILKRREAGGTMWRLFAGGGSGDRSDDLFALACLCRERDFTQAEALAVLRDSAVNKFRQDGRGDEDEQLRKTVARAWARTEPADDLQFDADDGQAPAPQDGLDRAPQEGGPDQRRRGRSFILLTDADLENQPPQRWIVQGVLPERSLAGLIGAPGSLKSFIALDLALAVASGRQFAGHRTTPAPTLYLSGEGGSGLGKRVKAWKRHHKIASVERARFLPEAVQFLERGDVDALLAAIRDTCGLEPPQIIFVDTLARSFVGGEENSAKDAGQFIGACGRLQETTGASVLLIHHVNKSAGTMRGSTAFHGAMDTVLETKRAEDGETVALTCTKQKDAEEFAPLTFAKREIDLGDGESSLVLERVGAREASAADREADAPVYAWDRTDRAWFAKLLLGIAAPDEGGPATNAEWEASCREAKMPRKAYYEAKKALLERGLVREIGGERKVRYEVVGEATPQPAARRVAPTRSRPQPGVARRRPHPAVRLCSARFRRWIAARPAVSRSIGGQEAPPAAPTLAKPALQYRSVSLSIGP